MNIVYGGSFNPPTKAHLGIIEKLYSVFNPSNLIILPVSNKYNKNDLIDDEYRFLMLKLLDKRIIVSDLELHKDFNGTYYSLKELSKSYADIHYVIGADNLEGLSKWINFSNLINEFKFIVMGRNDIDVPKIIEKKYSKYKDNFIYVDSALNESSTEFRKTRDKNLLTNDVYDFIIKNNLYKE